MIADPRDVIFRRFCEQMLSFDMKAIAASMQCAAFVIHEVSWCFN